MNQQLYFSDLRLKDLRQVVNITPQIEKSAFNKWFNYPYVLQEEELLFLKKLNKDRRLYLAGCSAADLKAKFIIPLLNKVNFLFREVADWYERPLSAIINGYELSGKIDFLVATGIKEPETPYFFIQGFKPSVSKSSPQDQLLSELLVALYLNKEQTALGAYVVGQLWVFLLLKKNDDDTYEYFISQGFNTLNEVDLQELYVALQGMKADIMEKINVGT